jgi:3-methyl-2-oxobutanoate hydroxymethyltransferase
MQRQMLKSKIHRATITDCDVANRQEARSRADRGHRYDYPSAQIVEEAGVDIVLVGDTAAMVVLGYDATTPVGMDEMLMMAGAVRRRLQPVADQRMPFGSYEKSNEQAIENAQRFVQEPAATPSSSSAAVPRSTAPARSSARLPVMGHRAHPQPRRRSAASRPRAGPLTQRRLTEEALALRSVGCFAIVFEAIPSTVTEALMPNLKSRSSGSAPARADGQVLVLHDLLGV